MDVKLVEIPPVRAIAVDGTGEPGGEEFTAAGQRTKPERPKTTLRHPVEPATPRAA